MSESIDYPVGHHLLASLPMQYYFDWWSTSVTNNYGQFNVICDSCMMKRELGENENMSLKIILKFQPHWNTTDWNHTEKPLRPHLYKRQPNWNTSATTLKSFTKDNHTVSHTKFVCYWCSRMFKFLLVHWNVFKKFQHYP